MSISYSAAGICGARASMLRGRESLVRLIGKRRRNLSLRPPSPPPSPPLSEPPAPTLEALPKEDGNGGKQGASCSSLDVDWVACPVCGKAVRGSDYMVNSHLDACLARGKKRKLTQRTLLQFNFSSDLKNETCSAELDQLESITLLERSDKLPLSCAVGAHNEFGAFVNTKNYIDRHTAACIPQENSFTSAQVSIESLTKSDAIKSIEVDHPTKPARSDTSCDMSEFPVGALESFIVGRRFSGELELHEGERITLIRDPENPKDSNAIKVISIDTREMLGYLPRELAKFISPLMSKFCLGFEGFITFLPKNSLDVVPIQLQCQEMVSVDDMDPNDAQDFEFLWRSALEVIETARTFPSTMIKYQQNFCSLIREVLKNHSHLFTDDEKSYLGSFELLSDDSQRLFIRLYRRKGPWFRILDICYPEISDSPEAAKKLCESGYLHSFEPAKERSKNEIEEVLGVLTTTELREISNIALLKLQKSIKCTRKKEYIGWLSASYEEGTCPSLPSMIFEITKSCVKISSSAEFLLWRVQRLFFLNGEQDLSAFLLVDLGLVKYPSYTCKTLNPIFPSQVELLTYEKAIEVAQVLDESLDDNNVNMVTKCIEISDCHISALNRGDGGTFLSHFSASWVHSKVLTLGISVYERERRYKDAIRLLKLLLSKFICDGRRGYWTLRLSVDLEHTGHLDESLTVAEEGILDPWVRAGSKMALQRRILRLGKPPRRWKVPTFAKSINRKIKEVQIIGRPLNCDMGIKSRFYSNDGSQCGVEQLVLQYYAGEEGGGWNGVHTESGIWMTIFGLLMWDTIFADVPDVFQTKFQTAPLDMDTDCFYAARRDLIESEIEKIYHGLAEEILIISWESHKGMSCRGVNWDRHSLSDLRAAVSCIGGPSLASLCRHLAQDYRNWSSGMPDLLLWRFLNGNHKGEAKLVEVKGPRDRLSEQQRAWLLILMDSGFDAEVCKVIPKFS